MSKSTISSNRLQTSTLKNGALILAILFFVIALLSFFSEPAENRVFDLSNESTFSALLMLAISLGFLIMWLYLKDRIIHVTILHDGLELDDDQELEKVTWDQVKSINQIALITPPLYRLKLTDRENSFLFITGRKFISIGIFSWDLSEMGKMIKQKKRQGHF